MFYATILVLLVLSLFLDPAIAGISSTEIKAASKSWTSTIHDWTPGIIGGGLTLAGVMFFMNKYFYAIGALGGIAFFYAAKAFTGTGEAALTDMAKVLFG